MTADSDDVAPSADQRPRTALDRSRRPVDPQGADPEDIPDPMPEELQERPDEHERIEAMEGEAPTG